MQFLKWLNHKILEHPYPLLPLVLFAVYALYSVLSPHSALQTGHLSDPDDYMRLNQVINWLSGPGGIQGWYDLSQPRLSPGTHSVIPWSRFVDLPLAFFMLPLIKPLGMMQAALTSSFIVPPLLFALLIILVPVMARPLLGRRHANLAVMYTMLLPLLLFNFMPGRVDHHNWSILIAGIGLYAIQCMLLCRGGWRAGILAAISFAIGLWIGTENMPCVILFLSCLTFFAAWRGGFALRNAAMFGFFFAIATAASIPAALPPSEWGSRAISWFSPADVIFAGLTAAILIPGWLIGRLTQKRLLRLALFAALSLQAATLFLMLVPAAAAGPFVDYESFNAEYLVDDIGEATPMMEELHFNPHIHLTYPVVTANFICDFLPTLLVLAGCGYASVKTRSRRRLIWLLNGLFVGITFALSVCVEKRMFWFENIFILGPLAYMTWRWWDEFKPSWPMQERRQSSFLTFFMLGVFPSILLPLIMASILPAPQANPCDLRPVATTIDEHFKNHPHTIMAGMNEGAELLFRTKDNVIGFNFDVAGNRDVFAFFSSRDDKSAIAALEKWHADLVLTCRSIPLLYTGFDHAVLGKNAFLHVAADGRLHLTTSLAHPTLAERLASDRIPSFLKPVEIPGDKDYLLFEVKNESKEHYDP